jgi:hypothetical protein
MASDQVIAGGGRLLHVGGELEQPVALGPNDGEHAQHTQGGRIGDALVGQVGCRRHRTDVLLQLEPAPGSGQQGPVVQVVLNDAVGHLQIGAGPVQWPVGQGSQGQRHQYEEQDQRDHQGGNPVAPPHFGLHEFPVVPMMHIAPVPVQMDGPVAGQMPTMLLLVPVHGQVPGSPP